MGKSSDNRGEVRERVTDANKVPLGRPAFFSGSKPSGAKSLLKPSYLSSTSGGNDNYDSSSSNSSSHASSSTSGMSLNFSNLNQHIAGLSQSSTASHNSLKQAADYSRWSDGSYSGFSQMTMPSGSNPAHKRDNEDSNDSFGNGNDERGRERKRKRRSRWMGGTDEKAVIPGMPTILPSDLPPDQMEAYIAQLQIEELTRKLRSGDLGIPPNPEDRSPSPEPIYGTDGKRLNTREYRTRKKLEEERHKLIQRLLKLNPDYKPPADYRAPIVKIVDRVPIPQEEHPEINFVGLLIGPRGNTLKGLEKDTGAKIIIRGKGSVKEGKVGGKAGHPLPGEDEPLHAYVTSNNPDSVKKACEKIKEIIHQGIDMPESQNDLRKNQLRELALLNGTLREGEGPKCSNCGATSHRTWHCPDKPNVTNSVICTVCGGAGHIGRDCRMKRPGAGGPPTVNLNEKAKIDEEYLSLMAELGEAPPKDDAVRGRMGTGKSFSTAGGQGLFDKASAPKAIMAPQPTSTSVASTTAGATPTPMMHPTTGGTAGAGAYPASSWSSPGSQPPPPGDLGKTSPSSTAVPPPPMIQPPPTTAWSYPPTYPPMLGQQWSQWGPPPPVPPPPGGAQPPPPGMYWQQSGGYGISPPPPPPPEANQPPPPPPS